MSARRSRHAARRRALELLYEADVRGVHVQKVVAAARDGDDPPDPYTLTLVDGVEAFRHRLDRLIVEHAKGWRLQRMPIVDRNLMRLGLFEILYEPDVPDAVAIDEAVRLAKELSTDDSGRFVNGVLARIAGEQAPAEPGS